MSGRPPAWHRDVAVALAAGALLVLWDLTGADLAVIRLFGGPAGFPWRDRWITSTVLHQGGRALAWAVLALQSLDALRPRVAGPTRAQRGRALAASVACLVVVPLIKQASLTSCPWDLAEFGGAAQFVSHWRPGVGDGGPGRCFPSGHAAAAFAFLSLHFLLRGTRPRASRRLLVAVGAAGLLFVGSSRVDLQACKLEYSIVSPK